MEGILPQVLPSLYKLIKSIFDSENNPDVAISSSYDAEEAEIAVHMIQAFVEQLRERFQPYVADTIEVRFIFFGLGWIGGLVVVLGFKGKSVIAICADYILISNIS